MARESEILWIFYIVARKRRGDVDAERKFRGT